MDPFDRQLSIMTNQGWEIVNRTENSAQLRKPKSVNMLGVVVFILLPAVAAVLFDSCFWAVALGGVLLVAADYVVKKPKMQYITRDDVEGPATS